MAADAGDFEPGGTDERRAADGRASDRSPNSPSWHRRTPEEGRSGAERQSRLHSHHRMRRAGHPASGPGTPVKCSFRFRHVAQRGIEDHQVEFQVSKWSARPSASWNETFANCSASSRARASKAGAGSITDHRPGSRHRARSRVRTPVPHPTSNTHDSGDSDTSERNASRMALLCVGAAGLEHIRETFLTRAVQRRYRRPHVGHHAPPHSVPSLARRQERIDCQGCPGGTCAGARHLHIDPPRAGVRE